MFDRIEAGARALRERWPHIFVLAGERADQMAQAVLAAAQQTEGEPVQPRPVSVPAPSGLPQATPHGPQSESAPSGDRPPSTGSGPALRSESSGRRGASQRVTSHWDVPKADAERASRCKEALGGASQPVESEREFGLRCPELGPGIHDFVLSSEFKSRLTAAEQNTEREYERAEQLAHKAKVAEAEKLRQTANANEFQRKWEAAERRADHLEQERDAWVLNSERGTEGLHILSKLDADRDRLQRELDEQTGRADCLQLECDRLKTLMRYGSEKCADALRGLYNALDRYGWCTGRSMESRDTLLAKARAALKEERPA